MLRVIASKFYRFYSLAHSSGQLNLRSDLHLARKAWHMSMGLFIVVTFSSGMSRATAVGYMMAAFALDLFLEALRLRVPAVNDQIVKHWGPLMRTHELTKMSGTPYYLASALLAIAIFPQPIAVLAILYLAVGDPIASIAGIRYGHLGPRFKSGKSWVGTFSGIVVCSLMSLMVFMGHDIVGWKIAVLTLVGGLAGGAAEILPLEIDDNFSIPIVSGFSLWTAYVLMSIPG